MAGALLETVYFMLSSRLIRLFAMVGWPVMLVALVAGDLNFVPQGSEYPITRRMVGDQTKPRVSLGAEGGIVVWQDNGIDGDGLGVGAIALNSYLSPISTRLVRVNQTTAGDQENAAVEILADGGAMFVWQGGQRGEEDIFVRVMSRSGTFSTGEIVVNTFREGSQVTPAIARLRDGNVVVVWSSHGQDGSMQGVFSQRLSPGGGKIGAETQVNQFSSYNQRSPAVAALEDGGYVVVWISEQQRYENSVDVYARRYDGQGIPVGNEFRVNTKNSSCANPAVCGLPGGGFMVVWSRLLPEEAGHGWDVAACVFDKNGARRGEEIVINGTLLESQYSPQLACTGNRVLVVWVSERQDGSREGIYARYVGIDGRPISDEFRVNTTSINRQIQPAVAGDNKKQFLVVWTSFVGGDASFDVMGQRYGADTSLPQPEPPFVVALDANTLLVSWPAAAGYTNLVGYRFYKDGETVPKLVTDNYVIVRRLSPESSHSFRVAIELADGRVSPISEPGTGKTWGWDDNGDGLPDDWQVAYWGEQVSSWPRADVDSDGDGVSNLNEFLAGTNPLDKSSVLKMQVRPTAAGSGVLVEWNAVQGSVYRVQSSIDLKQWVDVGSPQLAASTVGQTVVPVGQMASYYRVIRVR
ncbi:MAG: fibronectin type III domain-containing protein [Verrucomicrobiae bacterium]|nr:fibronectin type III domain-containing protein [Verrucomicrobiae bacterium]